LVVRRQVLRRISWHNREEGGENCIMRNFIICTARQMRRGEMGKDAARMDEKRNEYNILIG
jgi:hypothetical protein